MRHCNPTVWVMNDVVSRSSGFSFRDPFVNSYILLLYKKHWADSKLNSFPYDFICKFILHLFIPLSPVEVWDDDSFEVMQFCCDRKTVFWKQHCCCTVGYIITNRITYRKTYYVDTKEPKKHNIESGNVSNKLLKIHRTSLRRKLLT